jgi:hypothetical protein
MRFMASSSYPNFTFGFAAGFRPSNKSLMAFRMAFEGGGQPGKK